jgi:hypothetical protein
VEENFVLRTLKRTKRDNVKTDLFGRDRETKNPIIQMENIKVCCITTDRCLNDSPHRSSRETEFAMSKGRNKEENMASRDRGDRTVESTANQLLNGDPRARIKRRRIHTRSRELGDPGQRC